MGSILCCSRGPDDGAPGCCFCLPWPFWDNSSSSSTGSAARQRGYARVAPDQGRLPLSGSTGSVQQDSMDTFRCPPRPLPYDDPQFSHQTEQHPLVVGHDKASTQFQKSSQPRESKNAVSRSTCRADKADGSSVKPHSGGPNVGGTQVYVPSDCEDDCPICLEEYDYENPKIVLQCNHPFHLSCIYEWMEKKSILPGLRKGNAVQRGRMTVLLQVFTDAEDPGLNHVGCVHSVDEIESLDCLLKLPAARTFKFSL